jgi:hypothetical protein
MNFQKLINSDSIADLPTDANQPTYAEIKVVDSLFKPPQTDIKENYEGKEDKEHKEEKGDKKVKEEAEDSEENYEKEDKECKGKKPSVFKTIANYAVLTMLVMLIYFIPNDTIKSILPNAISDYQIVIVLIKALLVSIIFYFSQPLLFKQ